MAKKMMSLQLSESEMGALEDLCKLKDMSKAGIIRQALRLYQAVDARLCEGKRLEWVNLDGSRVETLIVGGCGPGD